MKYYKKLEPTNEQGICRNCNRNKQVLREIKNGNKIYRALCSRCHKSKCGKEEYLLTYSGSKVYKKHKKVKCESCNFIPIHMCQLDVDHIDGDHSNNDSSNLQTLCANCHRLKTYIQLHANEEREGA